jgi:hypothetical protein
MEVRTKPDTWSLAPNRRLITGSKWMISDSQVAQGLAALQLAGWKKETKSHNVERDQDQYEVERCHWYQCTAGLEVAMSMLESG